MIFTTLLFLSLHPIYNCLVSSQCSLVAHLRLLWLPWIGCPPTLTLWPTRNSLAQMTTLESMPEASSLVSSRSWGTKLKALVKSIIIASILTPLSKQSAMSWHTVMTWLSHEYPDLSPCCPLYNQSFLSQTYLKYPAITCCSCLQITEVKRMGL